MYLPRFRRLLAFVRLSRISCAQLPPVVEKDPAVVRESPEWNLMNCRLRSHSVQGCTILEDVPDHL